MDQEGPALSWDGCPPECMKVVGDGRVTMELSQHLPTTGVTAELRQECVEEERYGRSFRPAAVTLHSKHFVRPKSELKINFLFFFFFQFSCKMK